MRQRSVGGGGNRPGQPAELATAYVMLADPLSSYVSGMIIAVTSEKFIDGISKLERDQAGSEPVPFNGVAVRKSGRPPG